MRQKYRYRNFRQKYRYRKIEIFAKKVEIWYDSYMYMIHMIWFIWYDLFYMIHISDMVKNRNFDEKCFIATYGHLFWVKQFYLSPSNSPAAPPTSEKNWVDSYSSCSIRYSRCSGFRYIIILVNIALRWTCFPPWYFPYWIKSINVSSWIHFGGLLKCGDHNLCR